MGMGVYYDVGKDRKKVILHSDGLRDSAKYIISKGISNFKAAEIGVSIGINAVCLLKNTKVGNLHLIDPFTAYKDDECYMLVGDVEYHEWIQTQEQQDENYAKFLDNIKPYLDRVTIVKKSSIDAARDYQDEYFDYVYIDGCHNEEAVALDMVIWYPKVVEGGVLAGHDYPLYKGVQRAVDNFVSRMKCEIFSGGGDWCIIKNRN